MQEPKQPEVELQVGAATPTVLHNVTEKQWNCLQYTMVITPFFAVILLISTWFISLAIIGETVQSTTVSGTIGTASVKPLNIVVAILFTIIGGWSSFLRNIQIRIIFDRFPAYNIVSDDNVDNIELTDYVCSCCCTSERCGGPIYHNKKTKGNCVRNCKYYFTTFRGFNFISSITNLIGWIGLAFVFIFDVYTASTVHLAATGLTALFMFFYEFAHAATLCRQRQNEYALLKDPNKSWKHMHYFFDVVFVFVVPIFAVLMYFVHLISASYWSRLVNGTEDAPEDVNYIFEWIAFVAMVFYFIITSYVFARDDVSDELKTYALFHVWCCAI